MKVKQAKILLEKINRLFQSMTMDEHISEIEKELMRNYVKSLYEEFLPDNKAQHTPIAELPKAPKVVKPKVKAPPVVAPVVETPLPPAPKVEAVPEPAPTPTPTPRPQPTPTPRPAAVVENKIVSPPPIKAAAPIKEPPPPPPAPKPKKAKVSEELEDLFEFKQATDLSERLSQSPIKDLRNAMGINERFLTTNELFDGNSDALKDALSTMNGLQNFEQAKEYLSKIGEIYDWGKKSKKKKAKIFIKLVRRRFL